MEIFVLSLLTPVLGVALLVCDSFRQTALPFQSRSFWTIALRVLGGLSGLVGVVLVLAGFVLLFDMGGPSLSSICGFPLIAGLGLVAMMTCRQTFRVPRTWPGQDEDWDTGEVIDRYSPLSLVSNPAAAHLRSGAWVLALYPLLFVLPIVLFSPLILVGFLPFVMTLLLGFFCVCTVMSVAMAVSSVIQSRQSFQAQILWLLAIAVRNNLPLADELRSLAVDRGVKLKMRLEQAADDLEDGDGLSMALGRNGLLSAANIAAIRISEGGGRLDETLQRLAAQSTDRAKVFNLSQVSEVLVQVFVLLTIGFCVVGSVMYFIIPKFRSIFEGFDTELPESTVVLIDLSNDFINSPAPLFFWMGLFMILIGWNALRHIRGWSSLSFPTLMHWFPKRDAPEVLRALGGIARQGLSIPHKMLLLVHRPGRPDLGARYQRMSESMSAGETLSNAMFGEGIISPLQRESVAAGERGGHLEFVLFSMADALEQREFRRGALWAELLKPISVVGGGLLTAFVVISLFIPLVKLLSELS